MERGPLRGFLRGRRQAVGPVELRNVLVRVGVFGLLHRVHPVEEELASNLRDSRGKPLRTHTVRQGPVGQANPEGNDDADGDHHRGKGLGVALRGDITKDHVHHVVLAVHEEHQEDVDDDEHAHEHHADKVQGPRSLVTAPQLDVPREANTHGRSHRHTGEHHERREEEDHAEVRQLLQRVIGVEVLQRRGPEAEVGQQAVPRLRDDVPGRRHNALPQARGEEQRDVDQAVEDPQHHGNAVPVAAQADVFAARERQQWRGGQLIHERGVHTLFFRQLTLGELEPFLAGRTIVAPPQARHGAEHFPTGAQQQAHEDEVDEVAGAQPQGVIGVFAEGEDEVHIRGLLSERYERFNPYISLFIRPRPAFH